MPRPIPLPHPFEKLSSASCVRLPETQLPDHDAAKVANIFHAAGVRFQFRPAYYNRYVQTFVIVPFATASAGPPFPEHLRAPLNAQEKAKAKALGDMFRQRPAEADADAAFRKEARDVSWDVVKIIAARGELYWNILKSSSAIDGVPRSLALNMISTKLEIVDIAFNAFDVNSPWARAAVSCPAFLISASTTGLSAPLGIGLIQLISTMELFAKCYTNLQKVITEIGAAAAVESDTKQIVEAADHKRKKGVSYYKHGHGTIQMMNDRSEKVDESKVSGLGKDEVDADFNDAKAKAKFTDGPTRRCDLTIESKDTGERTRVQHDVDKGTGSQKVDSWTLP